MLEWVVKFGVIVVVLNGNDGLKFWFVDVFGNVSSVIFVGVFMVFILFLIF